MIANIYIPKIQDLYDPIMRFMAIYEEATTEQIRNAMVAYFHIPEDAVLIKSDEEKEYTVIQRRVNAATFQLVEAGFLERIRAGWFRLPKKAAEAIDNNYDFDWDYIKVAKEADDDKLPTPPNRYEYEEIKQLTVKKLVELQEKDVRIRNMLLQETMVLANGQLVMVEKPISRIMCSSDAEYADQTKAAAESGQKMSVSQDAKSGNVKTGAKREPHSNPPRGRGPWCDPGNFDKKPDKYKDFLMDIKGSADFADAFRRVLKQYANATYQQVADLTGIPKETIANYAQGKASPRESRNIFAIAIQLGLPGTIVRELLSLANFSPDCRIDPERGYLCILDVCRGMSKDEINKECDNMNIPRIF